MFSGWACCLSQLVATTDIHTCTVARELTNANNVCVDACRMYIHIFTYMYIRICTHIYLYMYTRLVARGHTSKAFQIIEVRVCVCVCLCVDARTSP